MLLAVRGEEVILKCNECDEYFSIAKGFWPPNKSTIAVCVCGSEARWEWKPTDPKRAPSPSLKWRHVNKDIKEAP